MQNSKFRSLIEQEIKATGDYKILTSPNFSILIKETQIEKNSSNPEKAKFTWLDNEGCVLTECVEEHFSTSSLPRIGRVSIRNKRSEYLKAYAKGMTQFNLRFTYHDADVIEALKAQSNKQAYIKELIRQDIKRKKEGK